METLEEMVPDRLVKRVYQAEMKGRRGRGWPRKIWNDNFRQWHVNDIIGVYETIM